MNYDVYIGLEIHCELLTKSKMFCSCKNEFGGEMNTRVCPVCLGMPGALPNVNKNAVALAIKAGIVGDCTINKISVFERKNYFYPDSPKAYQITQLNNPICSDGCIILNNNRKVRINRIQLEEDAGKLIHNEENGVSLVDFNRCGVPLIEIVTEPDMRSSEEVCEFVFEIAQRMKYAGVCNSRMEEGSLRVDVNISLCPENSNSLGVRAEIKNLNSYRSISQTIEYEIERQSTILDGGGRVAQETRRFSEDSKKTYSMRSKEDAQDYKYFTEPDIPNIELCDADIDKIKKSIPKMPRERYREYIGFGLSDYEAGLILKEMEFSSFYDEAVKYNVNYKEICNIMLGEVNRYLNEYSLKINEVKFLPGDIAKLAKLSLDGIISKSSVKDIVKEMFLNGGNVEDIARRGGHILENNSEKISLCVDEIILKNQEMVLEYKNGNKKIFGYLMGQLVRMLGKSTNPAMVKDILKSKLDE